ncbi:hypothetical protein INR49_021361, partial [Caranx melampygus]
MTRIWIFFELSCLTEPKLAPRYMGGRVKSETDIGGCDRRHRRKLLQPFSQGLDASQCSRPQQKTLSVGGVQLIIKP